jgi:chromosome segregation ATPase
MAMDPSDLTVEILKGIRDEVRSTNEGLHALTDEVRSTNERLDGLGDEVHALRADTNERLAETNDSLGRLERRQTETEVRLSTELVAVVGAVREVRDLLREDRALRDRVDDHERRIAAVENRAG